ncbi:MAG TPA: glycosyltransferase family 9 protein [Gammaproteobacteria bacterium]|nr:glycosyltransferase family 9 protein [Gammaproteobacteria bacterium]
MVKVTTPAPESLCVLRLSAVGDVCHTLPVVRTLQAAWPTTRITWIIGKLEASLVGDIPGIEFIIFDKSKGLGAYTALRRELKGRRFNLLLHMQMSLRASVASLAVKAPVRLGFDRQRAHDFQWLFTNKRIWYKPRQHVMDSLFGFSEALGIAEHRLRWDIPVPDEARAFAKEQIPDGIGALIISPCANPRFRNWRSWQPEYYAAVAEHAADKHGLKVLVTGGSSEIEKAYGERITALSKAPVANLVGKTSLKQLMGLLGRGTVLVSPDSGPVHMGTAAGIPVIGLYATTNPDRAGPYMSQRWRVDRYPDALARFNHETPDAASWGTRVRDPAAMDCIAVADVTGKLDELMAAKSRGESLVQDS